MLVALLLNCLNVLFTIPVAHMLSVMIEVGVWGWSISLSVVQMVATSCALRKRAPSAALLADAITFFSTVLSTWMAPLWGGERDLEVSGSQNSSLRKKSPPAHDHALVSNRYDFLLLMCCTMSLDLCCMVASRWAWR